MLTAFELKQILCDIYHFAHSLGRIYDMFLCVERGQTLEQVSEKPIIYLCVSKQFNKDEIIAEYRNHFKENPEPNLLLGATGELFECPKCSRKMTDFSFPAHLKKHQFILIAVNYSSCANNLEKVISRSTRKRVILPPEQIDTLEHLLESSTIKSLHHSVVVGEKRKIHAATYKKFVNFEGKIGNAKSLNQDINPSTLSRAMLIQKDIRNAIKAKLIVVIKKKRRNKSNKNRLQIFSGGLPGLGKKN